MYWKMTGSEYRILRRGHGTCRWSVGDKRVRIILSRNIKKIPS